MLTGFGITDSFCGFKSYKVSALARTKLTEAGYGMPLQFWVQAFALKMSVTEIPVARIYCHTDRSFGAVLDNPVERLRYYEGVIKREMERWNLT